MEHKIIQRDIHSLIFAEYNPRQLTKDQYQHLKDSIERFGLVDPIIVNKNKERKNIIVGGHQRVKVAKDMKIDTVPVLEIDLTYERERELNIRLNKNTGEWDMDNLANFFDMDELMDWGFNEDELVLPDLEPIAGLIDDDEVPEVEESICKAGDLWLLGEHRLLCGDATKKEDANKLMDGNKAELLFTSPPYSDMRDYNGDKDLSVEKISDFISVFYDYIKYQCVNLGIQRNNNNIVCYWDKYIKKAMQVGYNFLCWNIWHKNNVSIGNQTAFIPIYHEWIFVFGKENKDINRTKKRKSDISNNKVGRHRTKEGKMKSHNIGVQLDKTSMTSIFRSNSECNGVHPAMYPVELPMEYINAITNNGYIIVDPFSGSGSTLIACEKTGRKCYGMEIDTHYCDVIVKRWEQFTGKKAILDGNKEKEITRQTEKV